MSENRRFWLLFSACNVSSCIVGAQEQVGSFFGPLDFVKVEIWPLLGVGFAEIFSNLQVPNSSPIFDKRTSFLARLLVVQDVLAKGKYPFLRLARIGVGLNYKPLSLKCLRFLSRQQVHRLHTFIRTLLLCFDLCLSKFLGQRPWVSLRLPVGTMDCMFMLVDSCQIQHGCSIGELMGVCRTPHTFPCLTPSSVLVDIPLFPHMLYKS